MKRLAVLSAAVIAAIGVGLSVPAPASAACQGCNCNPIVDGYEGGYFMGRWSSFKCYPLGTVIGVWSWMGFADGGGGPGPRPY